MFSNQRLKRTVRVPKGLRRFTTKRLTVRDIEILYITGRMGVVTTWHVTTLFFGHKWTANKRLRQLFNQGFLNCFVIDPTLPNVYTLSAKGKAALQSRLSSHDHLEVKDSLKSIRNWPHHEALISLWSALAKAANLREDVELQLFRPERDIRRELNSNMIRLIPDGLGKLCHFSADGQIRVIDFVIEVDMASEDMSCWMSKVACYCEVRRRNELLHGLSNFFVLVTVPSLRRLELLIIATVEAGGQKFLFALQENIKRVCDEEPTHLFNHTFISPERFVFMRQQQETMRIDELVKLPVIYENFI